MAHTVKCKKCGEPFDRDKIQAVKLDGRRYGHATCYPELTTFVEMPNEDMLVGGTKQEREELFNTIRDIFGDLANYPAITKQVDKYTSEYDYTFSGIRKSLEYFYVKKGNDILKSKGMLSIVPYVYEDARNYYYMLWLTRQKNEEKLQVAPREQKETVFQINRPKSVPIVKEKKQKTAFSFLEEDDIE